MEPDLTAYSLSSLEGAARQPVVGRRLSRRRTRRCSVAPLVFFVYELFARVLSEEDLILFRIEENSRKDGTVHRPTCLHISRTSNA